MRNFKEEDFEGSGQYLVRCTGDSSEHYSNTGFLSTVMQKVGYTWGQKLNQNKPKKRQITLTDMSDGFTYLGYYDTTKDLNYGEGVSTNENRALWEYVRFEGKDVFVNYLNNPALCKQEMRFATHEELMRVMMNQSNRCR